MLENKTLTITFAGVSQISMSKIKHEKILTPLLSYVQNNEVSLA